MCYIKNVGAFGGGKYIPAGRESTSRAFGGGKYIPAGRESTSRAFGAVDSADDKVTKCHVIGEVALEPTS